MILYTLIFEDSGWGEAEEVLLDFVSPKRREKIARYKFDIDRKLSLYGALMVRMGAEQFMGCAGENLEIQTGSNGKPYLQGGQDCCFNLSHTKNAVLAGFSRYNIGVDVERIVEPHYNIMKKSFSQQEKEYLDLLGEDERKKTFYRFWTGKEAFGKWNGKGICQDFCQIDTMKESMKENLTAWIEDGYYFSVYSQQDRELQEVKLSIPLIRKYFLTMQTTHPAV